MNNNAYIIKKVFRKYLLFSILSCIASPLSMMVDGIVIGNFLGKEAMAAAGLVSPLYIFLSAFSGIIASGSISLCGQYIGKDQPEKVNRIFSSAVLWSVVMYLVCMAACICIPEQLAHILRANGDLFPLTVEYIRGLGAGIGLSILHLALVEFTKLDGSPALGPISIAVMAVVNIALDLVSVFWLQMGLFGIAMATSISYLAAILVCCIHFIRPLHTLKLIKIKNACRNLIALCKSGLPRAGNGLCFAITTAFINYRLVALGSSVALAAFSIQSSVALMVGASCLGVGSTTLLLSGLFYGEDDKKALECAVKTSLREGVLITLLVCGLCFVFLNPFVLLFGKGHLDVTVMATSAIRWKLLGLIVFTVNHVFVNYYQSTEKLKVANFVAVMEALPAQVLFIIVLPMFMGINGIWASSVMGGITTLLALTIWVTIQNRRVPKTLREYLLFPKSFELESSMQFSLSISNNLQEVTDVSEQVYAFCDKQGVDARRTYFLSLCVEEMVGNVVKYAFADDKTHFIDIRVLQKGDQLILRLRDDGIPFNPLSVPLGKEENIGKNIGIHLVRTLSHSMDYRYTVGLNNLLVKL